MRKERGWHAAKLDVRGKIIVAREFGIKYRKYISFILTYSKGKYIIEHPSYEFISTVSHFSSVQKDKRLSLNKTYLASVIRTLKSAGVWPLILNQSFLRVNRNNPRSNKGKVKRELTNLLS